MSSRGSAIGGGEDGLSTTAKTDAGNNAERSRPASARLAEQSLRGALSDTPQLVNTSVDELRHMMEDLFEEKLKAFAQQQQQQQSSTLSSAAASNLGSPANSQPALRQRDSTMTSGTITAHGSFRSNSFDEDDDDDDGLMHSPASRPQSGIFEESSQRVASRAVSGRTGMSSNVSLSSGDDGERSPRIPGSPSNARGLKSYLSSSTAEPSNAIQSVLSTVSATSAPIRNSGTGEAYTESPYIYDCDPRGWILAAGRLEKKRDGSWKAGWGKRFFVLTTSTLYYYLVPKRGGKGETTALLGDERGQIRIADIRGIYSERHSEGCLIHLECEEVKKNSMTQSSNPNIVLRAKSLELADKWVELMRRAQALLKQSSDHHKIGGGTLLEGYVPASMFSVFDRERDPAIEASVNDAVTSELSHELAQIQYVIHEHVLPIVESSKNIVRGDGQRASRIDPYFALACLVGINMICYMGPSMGNISVAMLLNLAFLSFVVYYEKLANEHDASVFRYNKAIKILQGKFDRVSHFLKNPQLVESSAEPGSLQSSPMIRPGSRKSIGASSFASDFSAAPSTTVQQDFAGDKADVTMPSVETPTIPEASASAEGASPVIRSPSPYEKNGKPAAGRTMDQVDEDEQQQCTWSPCDASIFNIRQVGYKVNKLKGPSESALYDLIGMDFLKGDTRLDDIHTMINMPPPRPCDNLEMIKNAGLPRIVTVNIQVPLKAPSVFGGEDPGVSVVFYFSIRPEVAKAAAEGEERPEIQLWKRFYTEFEYNEDIRRRFKGIGLAANIAELPIPKRLHSLNGKPIILFKSAQVQHAQHVEGGGLEITVMVHKFGMIARTLFNQFRETAENIKIRAAFLVQGEEDYELPECILGCGKITRLNFDAAKHIDHLGA